MPELKHVLDQDAAGIILLNTISAMPDTGKSILKKYWTPETAQDKVTVVLTVDGVEVPFTDSLNEMYKRFEEGYEAAVLKTAKDLIARSTVERMRELSYSLENALEYYDYQINNELRKLFDKE